VHSGRPQGSSHAFCWEHRGATAAPGPHSQGAKKEGPTQGCQAAWVGKGPGHPLHGPRAQLTLNRVKRARLLAPTGTHLLGPQAPGCPGGPWPGWSERAGGLLPHAEHHGAMQRWPIMLEPAWLVALGSLYWTCACDGAAARRDSAPDSGSAPCPLRARGRASAAPRSNGHPLLGVCSLRGTTGENVLEVPA